MELLKQPKTKRGEETLKRICVAAEELIAEKGYYNTQISDIAQKAGIATGTFYIYFPDKLSLFRYLLQELSSQLRLRIKKRIAGFNNLVDSEADSIKAFFEFLGEHMGLFQLVWQSQFVDPETFKQYYEGFSKGYVRHIKKDQEENLISKDFDPEHLSYYLMGIYNFIALKVVVFDEKKIEEEMIESIIKFVKTGLS